MVFVAAIANTLSYTMRTNMSVTIVAMVTHKSSNSSDSCFEPVGTVDDTVSLDFGNFHSNTLACL